MKNDDLVTLHIKDAPPSLISASRRTDLITFFPLFLQDSIIQKKANVLGPYGRQYEVSLDPENVHTFILWSKNFSNLIKNQYSLKELLSLYEQLYLLFTITGLGGSFIEPHVPLAQDAVAQLDDLICITGSPSRIGLRVDPVVTWKKDGILHSNIKEIKWIVREACRRGITRIIFSLMNIYGKCLTRSRKAGIEWIKPEGQLLSEIIAELGDIASASGIVLYNCCNPELLQYDFIKKSSCIDGELLSSLHPRKQNINVIKDQGQREVCGCSKSIDIGSYAQSCPHACLYCYANPRMI